MANAGWRFLEHGMPAATPVAATKYTAGRPAGDMRFKRIFGEHQRLARLVYGTTAMPWRARETIGGEHLAACVQHQRVYIPCAALPFSDHRLRKVFVLAQRADALSGGQQRMLAIGRTLMGNPDLILLDEPSEGLAPKLVTDVGEALRSLRGTDLAILLVEQNLALATRVGQRLYVMNKGTIVFHGTPAELAAQPDVEARYLGV